MAADTLIIVPTYNERDNLPQLVKRLMAQPAVLDVLVVDDNSPDQSAYHIFEYLNNTHTRINNRISIVHNLQHIGAMANMYFWVRKYCK